MLPAVAEEASALSRHSHGFWLGFRSLRMGLFYFSPMSSARGELLRLFCPSPGNVSDPAQVNSCKLVGAQSPSRGARATDLGLAGERQAFPGRSSCPQGRSAPHACTRGYSDPSGNHSLRPPTECQSHPETVLVFLTRGQKVQLMLWRVSR